MGTQFAIVYDVVVAAILIGTVLAGFKKGFASVVVGLAAVFVAFFCAMTFSEPVSNWAYSEIIEQPLEEAADSVMDDAVGSVTLSGLSELDYSRITVSGKSVEDIEPDYAGTGNAIFDLSNVDLSQTGIAELDLELFGLKNGTDYSSISGKTAELSMSDITTYGLGRMIVAQIIAVHMQDTEFFGELISFTGEVGEKLPLNFGPMAQELEQGSIEALRTVVITMADTSSSARDAVINGIIEPTFRIAAQTLSFTLIMIVVSILMGILASCLKLVNKIPAIGSLNAFGGGLAGFVEGLLAVFIVCILVRFVIMITDGSVMILNNMTIENTYLFKIFYNFEFLDFLI